MTHDDSHTGNPVVLLVDDQHRSFRILLRLISRDTFSPLWVPDEPQGLKGLKEHGSRIKIIVIDLKSSGMGGGGFLHQARKIAPHAAILITAPLGPFLYQNGSFYDFSGPSLKHHINSILLSILQKAQPAHKAGEEGNSPLKYKERFGVIIGGSKSINEIYRLIEKLKQSSATVLIQGESGTGKELVAQTIHQTSSRSNGPFIALNCGAIPANLVESELFGHEKGAFTTALHQRKGSFEIAHGGTLFLDEIGELERDVQVKLLRVLQERELRRVGGNRSFKTDVRIIAATSRDLKSAVAEGHFRDDLFYRLHVVPIHIPPLRERRKDILPLLDHFFHRAAKEMTISEPFISEETIRFLLDYSYPGNVRELSNIVERLLVTCSSGKITVNDLPFEIREETERTKGSPGILKDLPDGGIPMEKLEKELIVKTLKLTSWNKTAAAKMLGVTRRLLYLRLSQYKLATQQECHLT
jgi:DNA-binding NtrC family response regulator